MTSFYALYSSSALDSVLYCSFALILKEEIRSNHVYYHGYSIGKDKESFVHAALLSTLYW